MSEDVFRGGRRDCGMELWIWSISGDHGSEDGSRGRRRVGKDNVVLSEVSPPKVWDLVAVTREMVQSRIGYSKTKCVER